MPKSFLMSLGCGIPLEDQRFVCWRRRSRIFPFVLPKIRSRRLERMEPPILGETIEEVSLSRVVCLSILPKHNLDKEPRYQKVIYEAVEIRENGTIRNEDVMPSLKPTD